MSNEEFEGYMNYGVPGKLKSETKWFSIEEFVGLRPKQYSYITENDKWEIRAKGLSMTSTSRYITHQMCVDQVLKDQEALSCKMSNIQSKNFRMFTQYIYKRALVNYENKRYWLDSIYSIPYGHPWIKKIESDEMKIEEAIDKLASSHEYTYELCGYKKKEVDDKKEEEELMREEEAKKNIISNEEVIVTNLNKKELEIIGDKDGFKPGINKLLSNPAGLKILGGLLKGRMTENKL